MSSSFQKAGGGAISLHARWISRNNRSHFLALFTCSSFRNVAALLHPSSFLQLFLPLILFILFQCSFSLFSFPALDLCFLSFIHSTICWFLCGAQQWLRHAIVTTFMELILSGVGWWTENKVKYVMCYNVNSPVGRKSMQESGWVEGRGIAVVNRMLW